MSTYTNTPNTFPSSSATNHTEIKQLKSILDACQNIVIGAGSGLSTAAGLTYSGTRFRHYFSDFERTYGFHDMYAGGFYPYQTPEAYWAFWSRSVWINRYAPIPKNTYDVLQELVEHKNYFVLTTNVDHCFQRSGFDKERLFYTQGDYGLFQCSEPCCKQTWDNKEIIKAMVLAQGFEIAEDKTLIVPEKTTPTMTVPSNLIPYCPHCDRCAEMNLRVDETFVEDTGWHAASKRYNHYLQTQIDQQQPLLFLELGVGLNTPGIIKYPFWEMTAKNRHAQYVCLNAQSPYVPKSIQDRSTVIVSDIDTTLHTLATDHLSVEQTI